MYPQTVNVSSNKLSVLMVVFVRMYIVMVNLFCLVFNDVYRKYYSDGYRVVRWGRETLLYMSYSCQISLDFRTHSRRLYTQQNARVESKEKSTVSRPFTRHPLNQMLLKCIATITHVDRFLVFHHANSILLLHNARFWHILHMFSLPLKHTHSFFQLNG